MKQVFVLTKIRNGTHDTQAYIYDVWTSKYNDVEE